MAESEKVEATVPEDVGIDATELASKLDVEEIQSIAEQSLQHLLAWAQSPQFYAQLG